MATTITADCISCGACEPECPNNAISQADPIYVIDPKLCTECVGFHDFEACAAVCPVDCCVPDPKNVETEDLLIARARALHTDMDFGDNFPSRFRKGEAVHEAAAPATAQAAAAAPAAEVKTEPPPNAAAEAKTEPVATAAPVASSTPAPAPAAAASVAAEPAAKPAAAPKPATPAAAKAPVQPAAKPAPVIKPAEPKKVFPNELPEPFEEVSKRYGAGGSLNKGLGKWLVIFAQPLLGALPHGTKKALEAAVQSPLFTAAGSTGLNIVHNAVLYPLVCMAVAALVYGPSMLFSQAINQYVFLGLILAGAEAVYRLKDGIFSPKPADDVNLRPSVYGAPLGLLLQPLLQKKTGLVRDLPIPVDGFYSPGFIDKLERERRYGNVYTIEDRGGALLLKMEFPRSLPDAGFLAAPQLLPREMPDYDYDLVLQNGEFVVKGRCADEQVRKISSSFGAFPPEFTTVIPLRDRVTGFAHRCENKLLEVLLVKDDASRWSESHH